jgi:hypothetical protein
MMVTCELLFLILHTTKSDAGARYLYIESAGPAPQTFICFDLIKKDRLTVKDRKERFERKDIHRVKIYEGVDKARPKIDGW